MIGSRWTVCHYYAKERDRTLIDLDVYFDDDEYVSLLMTPVEARKLGMELLKSSAKAALESHSDAPRRYPKRKEND